MKTSNMISLMCVISLIAIFIIATLISNQNQRLQSDLCYSLKTNRILMGGLENRTNNTEAVERFYVALEYMEERNWMGCGSETAPYGFVSSGLSEVKE